MSVADSVTTTPSVAASGKGVKDKSFFGISNFVIKLHGCDLGTLYTRYSQRGRSCNLYSECQPTAPVWEDEDFCVKGN